MRKNWTWNTQRKKPVMLCESFGWNMDEIMQMNVDKLKARYPDGFDVERANHRAVGDV